MVVHASKASSEGRKICLKLKDIIPRQLVEVQKCCLSCVIIFVQHTRNFWQLSCILNSQYNVHKLLILKALLNLFLEKQTAYKNVLCSILNMIRMM